MRQKNPRRLRRGQRIFPDSVVKSKLGDVEYVALNPVHEAILLVDSSGPVPAQVVPELFRLADAFAGMTHDVLDDFVYPVSFHSKCKVLGKHSDTVQHFKGPCLRSFPWNFLGAA